MMPPVYIHLNTINCFGVPFRNTTARLATLGQELNRSGADVLCVQEVQLWSFLPTLRRALSNYPYLAYQPHLFFAPKGGLVTWSRWPVEQQRFVLYRQRGRWLSPAFSDWLLHKGILLSYLNVRGQPITVVNTHLLANYSGDWSPGNDYARQEHAELRQLADVIDRIERNRLVIIAGDFNVPSGTWLYEEFRQRTQLLDVLDKEEEPTFRPPPFFPARYAQPLDHVLIRPLLDCSPRTSARLLFREKVRLTNGRKEYLSDHLGVEAHVEC